ncbi:MAG: dihydrolipoamide acetyltransferase family protein [Bacteroidota bacterium]
MAVVDLYMPKMGESIVEATVIAWHKEIGDTVEDEEIILEIATDKVDSEIPSTTAGILVEKLYEVDDVVPIGAVFARIQTEATAISPDAPAPSPTPAETNVESPQSSNDEPGVVHQSTNQVTEIEEPPAQVPTGTPLPSSETKDQKQHKVSTPDTPPENISPVLSQDRTGIIQSNMGGRFFSPLVRNIARAEGISSTELQSIPGSGIDGRVTKQDLLEYVEQKRLGVIREITNPQLTPFTPTVSTPSNVSRTTQPSSQSSASSTATPIKGANEEIIAMDRMRKVIASHMKHSQSESATVTSFVEADATHLVHWRNRVKAEYQAKYGQKLTFSPLFTEAVIKAIGDYPTINASIDGDHLIVKKDINIGMATAMENGNLIVPVIKQAQNLNLNGLTAQLNDLTGRARVNQLRPDEIQGGTFTISNIGTYGNIMGTPIINQPQLAILALGAIKKKPVIQETPHGDIIAIRHMMFLSLSFDHRAIDGYLGGVFLNRIAHYIEAFDPNRPL